jgi:hypothetical protein
MFQAIERQSRLDRYVDSIVLTLHMDRSCRNQAVVRSSEALQDVAKGCLGSQTMDRTRVNDA